MKRSSPNRFSALVAALLVLFAWTGDAVGLHPCPHHSALPTAADTADAGAADEDHGAHAPDPADHGEHGACTCVGCCPAGAALPAFAAALRETPILDGAPPSSLAGRATDLPARFPPFVLPYGQAPPLRT